MNTTARVVLIVAGLGLVGLIGLRVNQSIARNAKGAPEAAAALSVEVFTTSRQDMTETVKVAGTLRALNQVDIVADVPGRVEAVMAEVGDTVRKGAVLARLEQRELSLAVAQAEAGLAMAEAGRDTALRDLKASESVAEVGGVTDSQLVAARARAAAAEAQVKQANAALGMARERQADATIRSPIDGVVTRRQTDVGRMVNPGMPIFSVHDLSALELVIAVDEHTAARIQPDTPVVVRADTLDAPVSATVRTISPALDANSRKAELIVRLAPAHGLMPNGTATAEITLGQRPGAIAVPLRAVVDDGAERFVYVVEGGVAHRVPVQAGIRQGDEVEITGVEPGSMIVLTGQSWLVDGASVAPHSQEPS